MKPRPYQLKLESNIREGYKQKKKRVLMVSPTGSGKTFTFTYMAKKAYERGKKIVVITHKESILNQISKTFEIAGIPHGIIKAKRDQDLSKSVQVCSIQTLARRIASDKIQLDADLVIMDEAHHAAAGQWSFMFDYFKDAYFLGATATPCRLDGKGLGNLFEFMVIGPTVLELIELGNLVMPKVYRPDEPIDLSQVGTSMGDFNQRELDRAINRAKITGDVIANWKDKAEGLPTVAFCTSVDHCKQVAHEFNAAGYKASWVDGSMSSELIAKRLEQLGDGTITVLCSCNLISEGTDIPAIGCVIQIRATHSLSLYLQMVGRGLRPCEGKDSCIILDHVDNFQRHGHPAQDRQWSLDMTKKKVRKGQTEEADIKVSECKECYAVFLPADVCPECGTPVEKKKRVLSKVDGELKEVTLEEAQKIEEKKQKRMQVGRAGSLTELYEIAKDRGYKKGWILFKFKSKVLKEYKACGSDKNKLVKFQNHWELMQWDTVSEQALERAITKKYNTFMSLKPKLK